MLSECLKHFCEDCGDEEGGDFPSWCSKCEKDYCKDCVAMTDCPGCFDDFCNECEPDMKECENEICGEVFCDDCAVERTCHHCNQMRCRSCNRSYKCDLNGCNTVICRDCVLINGEGGRCHSCRRAFCSTECRYLNWIKDSSCSTCSAAATDFQRNNL